MGLFDLDSSDHTCPDKTLADTPQLPLVNGLSFHDFAVILSGACTAFSCIITLYLIMRHATRFSIPKEQKQIIRIIFMIPVFAIVSFLSVCFMDAGLYLEPLEDLYESFAFAAFFLLLCAFVQEDDEERRVFFENSGTMGAYNKSAFGVFQFPVVMLVVFIVTEITEGAKVYCATSNKPYFAHIWVTVIRIASTAFAIISLLRFFKIMKKRINHRKPLPKFIAFKGIVFLSFLQNTIFSFLTSSSDLKPTSDATFKDITVGVPNLIISIEMAIFSIAFLLVYRTSEYSIKHGASAVPLGHGGYHGGFMGLKAILAALNISDIIRDIIGVPANFTASRRPQAKSYTGSQGERDGMILPQYQTQWRR